MLIYLDLETTGLEATDRICSIGLIAAGDETVCMSDLVKPPKKIRPEAMAVHHITNEMVAKASSFHDANTAKWLEQHNSPEHILIGHNVAFDLEMMQREGFIWKGGVIDTLKCTKHLIEELEQFSLQYLRYELGLYKSEEKMANQLGIELIAHTVLSDALHVRLLHEYLNTITDDERMMELTTEQALIKKFSFGKYNGRFIEEIAMIDQGYLYWMLESLEDLDGDLEYSIRHYLGHT